MKRVAAICLVFCGAASLGCSPGSANTRGAAPEESGSVADAFGLVDAAGLNLRPARDGGDVITWMAHWPVDPKTFSTTEPSDSTYAVSPAGQRSPPPPSSTESRRASTTQEDHESVRTTRPEKALVSSSTPRSSWGQAATAFPLIAARPISRCFSRRKTLSPAR